MGDMVLWFYGRENPNADLDDLVNEPRETLDVEVKESAGRPVNLDASIIAKYSDPGVRCDWRAGLALVPGLSATSEARSSLKKLPSLKELQRCLEFKDMTPPRLDCYDAIVPPRTTPEPVPAKVVYDCRFMKDDDQRLICFNRFVENPAKPVVPEKSATPVAPKATPSDRN